MLEVPWQGYIFLTERREELGRNMLGKVHSNVRTGKASYEWRLLYPLSNLY